MTHQNDALVQGLSYQRCTVHLQRIMQHWDGVLMADYLFNFGIIFIFYTSLSVWYTLSFPFSLVGSSGPDRHVSKNQKPPLMDTEEKAKSVTVNIWSVCCIFFLEMKSSMTLNTSQFEADYYWHFLLTDCEKCLIKPHWIPIPDCAGI